MTIIDLHDREGLRARIGEEVGVSDWLTITQDRINRFAAVTGDDQWIHLDPARAQRQSPYGSTIAHGFLTLSLLSVLARSAVQLSPLGMAINYGLNRVRFVTAVPAESRIRGRFTLQAIEDRADAIQIIWSVLVESEKGKVCLAADWIVRYSAPSI